jgi:hypothetical protein
MEKKLPFFSLFTWGYNRMILFHTTEKEHAFFPVILGLVILQQPNGLNPTLEYKMGILSGSYMAS